MNNRNQKIIAIAGPKGGCGKTTFAVGLAQTLAVRNHEVCLVDFDASSQSDAFALGVSPDCGANLAERVEFNDVGAPKLCVRSTQVPRLSMASLAASDLNAQLLARIRAIDCEYAILDLRSGNRDGAAFVAADIPILVSTPEPSSIYAATQWVRYIVSERLRGDEIAAYLPGNEWTFNDIYDALPANLRSRLESIVRDCFSFFVLNSRREGSETQQAEALCHAWWRMFGAEYKLLGSLRFEERRWFYARQFSLDDPLSQEDSMRGDLEEISDKIVAFSNAPLRSELPCGPLLSPLYDAKSFLNVEPAEEPRHAYRRLFEGYRRENGIVSWGCSPEYVRQSLTQLDAAWQHIHAEAKGTPNLPSPEPEVPKTREISVVTSNSSLPSVTRRLSGTFAAFSNYDPAQCEQGAGAWLKACREKAQVTLQALAMKTRIVPKTLDLLERQELTSISSSHLQAYLFEIAKALDLPLDELRRKFGFKE